jgi:DNA-binding transcriptional MerR regulator
MGSWSQSRTLSHFRDQRSIKKTELTANEVFTEKDLERLDQREAAQAKPVTLMGHKRLNDKPEEMRKEIHKFMEWANQPVQIKQYRKPVDSGYRRFHTREQKDDQLRNSDILPYWTKQHR